jgi:hypothetical protein
VITFIYASEVAVTFFSASVEISSSLSSSSVSARKSANETTGPPVLGARNSESAEVTGSFSAFGIGRTASVDSEPVRL